MKMRLTIVLLLILVLTNCQNDCASSRLTQLQTGQILLNPNDLGDAGATKNYYQSLSRAQFKAGDFLGSAFAIAGFQTACSQTFYSLMVDVVQFQNQNTKMRIVIDFKNPNANALTVWTKVKLTYLVVSSTRYDTGYGWTDTGYIWATNTQVDLTESPIKEKVFNDNIFSGDGSGCGLTYDSLLKTYKFGVECDATSPVSSAYDKIQNDIAIHAYIMGFKYGNDSTTIGQSIAVSLKWKNWMDISNQVQLAFTTPKINDRTNTNYGISLIYGTSLTGNGPQFILSNYNKQLKRVKIAIVMTLINPKFVNAQLFDNGLQSLASYSYSGLYTVVKKQNYNIQSIIDKTSFNKLSQKLPSNRYIIYGLSQFEFNDGSKCTSFNLDLSINSPNAYTLSVNNVDFVKNVIFQADIYTPTLKQLCNSQIKFTDLADTDLLNDVKNGDYKNIIYLKSRLFQQFSTVPSNNIDQNVAQSSDNPLDLTFNVNGKDSDTTNVQLNAKVIIARVTNKKPYGIRLQIVPISQLFNPPPNPISFHNAADKTLYQFNIKVNGFTIYNRAFTGTQLASITPSAKEQKFIGINLLGSNATVQYNLIIPRRSQTGSKYIFNVKLDLFQFQSVYDPVTQCCIPQCPAKTGLDVSVTPVSCISCDLSKGLVYDASTSSCKCRQGYYINSQLQFQCFPCTAKLCSVCSAANTAICTTCINGGLLNTLTNTCSCNTGFYEFNNTCPQCPYRCGTCSVKSTCETCSDSRRDINNNCSCIAGFFDAGVDKCQACNPSCATCSNISTCLTCDSSKNRILKGSVCVCDTKYYELIYQNGSRECKLCSIQCATCSLSATECITCNNLINRVQGYDSLGRRACICKAGYHSLPDGSCIQSDCKSDKYCSQCQQDLSLCIQCQSSLNRVIKLPEHICICDAGFYQDPTNKQCKPCASGCAKCSSATQCDSCVAQSTLSVNGTCKCNNGLFFTNSSNNVRYCKQCTSNCDICNNTLSCQTCKAGFTLTTDNSCVCPKKNYINKQGQCVACRSGCQSCTSNTTCFKCIAPLFVDNDTCVAKCSQGTYISGSVCYTCASNCVGCTSATQCYFCKDGFYLHQGSCYSICPSGTVINNQTNRCTPCNSPCRTCSQHPSSCTSCEIGVGFLQITGNQQTCVKQCADGTYPKNNVCQVCDFKCSKCLGSAKTCIACPTGRYLYNSACWDYCPGVLMNNTCINACPAGYYRLSDQECKVCGTNCNTCDNANTCLTCKNNLLSKDGNCVDNCGVGYYAFRGICVACDKSCKSCQNIPTQCIDCASGYIKLASKCVLACPDNTFLDPISISCKSCSSQCKTCSSQKVCTSCPNNQILPIGGQCFSCIYPCDTCTADLQTCTSCLSGFSLSNGQCLRSCPAGSRSVNGVCQCSSGLLFNGGCVSVCPSGYTKIGSECKRCQSPCSQCSGSIDYCTQCLDSCILKPNGICQSNSLCNYGQQELNGKCQRICDQGSYYQNGACIFGGCPQGFRDNGFGGCILAPVNPNRCDAPLFRLNSVCVQTCGNGFFPNCDTRTCEQCPNNCQSCINKNYCLTCAPLYTSIDGKCIFKINCPSNQFIYNNGCVSICPVGSFLNNGVCVRSCPAGSFYYLNLCYNSCPSQAQYYTENTCVNTCPIGTTLFDKVCTPIPMPK